LPAHQLVIKSSPFAGDIAKLCALFTDQKEEVQTVQAQGKSKKIAKTSRRTCRENKNKKFKMNLMSTSTNIGDFSEQARKEVSI
jgi:hypothetical protein